MAYFGNVVPPAYQPQTTPFPQGFNYGVGAGMNNLVSNLIAASLYKREQERQARQEALQRLGVLGQVGGAGALNTPGGQELMQGAGMPGGQIPLSPEAQLHQEQVSRLREEGQRRQQFKMEHPEWASYPDSVLDELIKLQAQQNMISKYPELLNQFLGAGQPQASEPEYMGVPNSTKLSVPQGPTSGAPAGAAPGAGRLTRKIGIGPGGLTANFEVAPESDAERQDRERREGLALANKSVNERLSSGGKLLDDEGNAVSLVQMAKKYGVDPSYLRAALVNTEAQTIHRVDLPAGSPTMDQVYANYRAKQERVIQEKGQLLTEKRLDMESRRLEQLIAQGNRAERTHNDELTRQYRTEAQKAATTILESARFMYDENEKDIKASLQPTPEQLDKRRELANRISDAITKLQSLVPAAEVPGRPTPLQSPTGAGKSGYPSNWFNPKAPTSVVPSPAPQMPETEENEY